MTLAFITGAEPGIVTNLVDNTTDAEAKIFKYGPTLYLTPENAFLQDDGSGKLVAWHDSTGGGPFKPTSAPLGIVDEGDGLKSLNFTGTNGQALFDVLNLDRMPASGKPCTIAMLARCASGAGNFGGGLFGSPTPYGNDMVAGYIDRGTGNSNLQTQFGVAGKSMYSSATINDNAWHLLVFTYKGSDANGLIIDNGVPQPLFNNIFTISANPLSRKVQIGNYGPIGTDAFIGKIAAMAIFPTYVGEGLNSDLLTNLTTVWGAYRTSLNS